VVTLRTSKVTLTTDESIYVPRKGQSIFPCARGDRDVNRTRIIPYTNSEESK